MQGDLSELLIYRYARSDGERASVDKYRRNKCRLP
jgi:hypothetical protein